MRKPAARTGSDLKVHKREIEFSFWPVCPGPGGGVTNSKLFATDPWPVIVGAVERRCPKNSMQAALAFVEQAHHFYKAAGATAVAAAKPVLLYYYFMNLAKALVLTEKIQKCLDEAQHGLSEQPQTGAVTVQSAYLKARPSTPLGKPSVFDEFLRAIQRKGLPAKTTFNLPVLLTQVVPGHRLLLSASGGRERFIAVESIRMLDGGRNEIWLRLCIREGDLSRAGVTQKALLEQSRLGAAWQGVDDNNAGTVCLEQSETVQYQPGYIANNIPQLVASLTPHLWQTVTSWPPYRKYYIYLATHADKPCVLPQLLSVYAIMFYLSSITRYRPHRFDEILASAHGPFIQAFLNDQPSQFLFLMASEFAKREVARAALI